MPMNIPESENCLCGSGVSYVNCCSPFHQGLAAAPTAETLMRSRFSAYAQRNADYLLKTWDNGKRPDDIDFSKETATWHRLQIIQCKKGGISDSKGVVEFKAYYRQDDIEYVMHEISSFIKQGQHWLYQDGVVKSIAKVNADHSTTVNQGRNALCACGSGKKFKRCCGQ